MVEGVEQGLVLVWTFFLRHHKFNFLNLLVPRIWVQLGILSLGAWSSCIMAFDMPTFTSRLRLRSFLVQLKSLRRSECRL